MTKAEKTLYMRISFIMGELWDIVNEWEAAVEACSKKDGYRHIKNYYAKEMRKQVARIEADMLKLNYEEVE